MTHHKTIGLIPARYASSRLPGKLLLPLGGSSILKSVYDKALLCQTLDGIAVVTDHEGIYEHVKSWNGEVYMSRSDHQSGTDRIAEIAGAMDQYDYVVNIQGDEPFIVPRAIDYIVEVVQSARASIGTLISLIHDIEDYSNPHVVKVVKDIYNYAMYFSRSSIPYHRNDPKSLPSTDVFKHIGLYVFEREALLEITKIPVSNLEESEKLEQLRWLEHGKKIITATVEYNSFGIDTREDYDRALLIYNSL
ncbi:MAG: 3-deoxy-manno-octulosonate cytidylyltransferase [Saprospiraceae bacterium]|nr:3-deoxy-manno-octulosonate cytidylyltransferase [Saprospiraceae bacterium]